MIRLSRLAWPQGLTGRDIDAIARAPLWSAGFDYAHGTGHGVGAYLGVHEGPASISRRSREEIRPGMILSNEPGYYREGAFGIRIENLVAVNDPKTPTGGDLPMLSFETLTHVPIDRRLIIPEMLESADRTWLNAYHARTIELLSGSLSPAAEAWLKSAAAPI